MKKTMFAGTVLISSLLLGSSYLFAQPPYGNGGYGGCGRMGGGYAQSSDGWHCPGAGQGHGGWRCAWNGYGRGNGSGGGAADSGQPLTQDQAMNLLDTYGNYKDNPRLQLKEMVDKGDYFEATIITRDGSLVDRIQIDKNSGRFRSVS